MAPCSRCEKSGKECVAPRDPKHSRCAECVRHGRTCDVRQMNRMPSVHEWETLEDKRRKLRAQKREAAARLQEATARLLRLETEEDTLDQREQKMIAAGLNSLDELDAAEELERKERAEAEEQREKEEREKVLEDLLAQPTPPSDSTFGQVADPALFDPSFDLSNLPSGSGVADWGFGGGTPQASQGS